MSDPAAWLGENELLLHIGVHKTGTTAVQGALIAAREEMERQGVRLPGTSQSYYLAAMAAIGKRRGWENGGAVPSQARWNRLVDAVNETPGRLVLSTEAFCEANLPTATSIVEQLGGERVKVLITLRPLWSLIPSSWQQYVKGGMSTPYDVWLTDVMQGPRAKGLITPSFWKRNDHGRVVDRWVKVVGPERVAVVVVDNRESGWLFRTFESIIGLESGTLQPDESVPSNRSLSGAEVELIRTLNSEIENGVDYRLYNQLVRQGGFQKLVEGRRPGPGEGALVTPAWAAEPATKWARDSIKKIKRSGVLVIGDLESLAPDLSAVTSGPAASGEFPAEVPVEAAALLVRGTLEAAVAMAEASEERFAGMKAKAIAVRQSDKARSSGRLGRRVVRRVKRVARRLVPR